MEQAPVAQNSVLAVIRKIVVKIHEFLMQPLEGYFFLLLLVAGVVASGFFYVHGLQATRAAASSATSAAQQQQLAAANYVPSLAACNKYAPQTDGVSLSISVASGTQLCVASASIPLYVYGYGNNAGSIKAPGGIAITGYMVYEGHTVSYPETDKYVMTEAVASKSDNLSLDVTPLNYNRYALPTFVEVYYLPPTAPSGANAYFGARALAQYQTGLYSGIADVNTTDSRLGMLTYPSTEAALEQYGKGR